MPKYKTETVTTSVSAALNDATGIVESLAEEMGEWRDNTEEKLGHTSKWESVSEAADALENIQGELAVDVPEDIEDRQITRSIAKPYGRKSEPRWMRASNASAALQAVVEDLRECLEADIAVVPDLTAQESTALALCRAGKDLRGMKLAARDRDRICEKLRKAGLVQKDKWAPVETFDRDDVEALVDTLQEQAEALESVEFPSMYG